MKFYYIFLLTVVYYLSFFQIIKASSQYALPSLMITNWQDQAITWANSHDCREHNPVRFPGVNSYRYSKSKWDQSSINQDSFAIIWNGKIFDDPMKFQGTDGAGMTVSSSDGTFTAHYNRYDGGPFNPVDQPNIPFTVDRTIFMPPNEHFYVVQYNITNISPVGSQFKLLDYVETPKKSQNMKGNIQEQRQSAMIDIRSQKINLIIGSFNQTSISEFQIGSNPNAQPNTSPLVQLRKNKKLRMSKSSISDQITIGLLVEDNLNPGESKTFSFYRINEISRLSKNIQKRVLSKSPVQWQQQTANNYQNWLSQSSLYTSPSSSSSKLSTMDENEINMFNNSLIFLKNGQNPDLGTIAASFHPLYGYKVWMRDGLFAAMILDVAGYHSEAEKFLFWASKAQLREQDGAFHTNYDLWTGNVVSFVEPQYDADGAYLSAIANHAILKDAGSSTFLSKVKNRVREIESFFLNNRGHDGLVPPDYSIWEESSDPLTGKPLPTSFFTFTQSMAFGGIHSAVNIERSFTDKNSTDRIIKLTARAKELQYAIQTHLYNKTHNYFMRSIWSDTLQPDVRADGSSTAVIWQGVCNSTDIMGWESREKPHLQKIISSLTQLDYGIARYERDPFFFDSLYNPCGQEVAQSSPPWGVVTMFTAWSEYQLSLNNDKSEISKGFRDHVKQRLKWMVKHSAKGNAPVGEAVDGISGNFVWASAPDIYEHGGVYVWTTLIDQGIAPLPNPLMWPRINIES